MDNPKVKLHKLPAVVADNRTGTKKFAVHGTWYLMSDSKTPYLGAHRLKTVIKRNTNPAWIAV